MPDDDDDGEGDVPAVSTSMDRHTALAGRVSRGGSINDHRSVSVGGVGAYGYGGGAGTANRSFSYNRNNSASYGGRAVSVSHLRARLDSANMPEVGLRSRSVSQRTFNFTGLTCATGSEQGARQLTLVPSGQGTGTGTGGPPPFPGARSLWGYVVACVRACASMCAKDMRRFVLFGERVSWCSVFGWLVCA